MKYFLLLTFIFPEIGFCSYLLDCEVRVKIISLSPTKPLDEKLFEQASGPRVEILTVKASNERLESLNSSCQKMEGKTSVIRLYEESELSLKVGHEYHFHYQYSVPRGQNPAVSYRSIKK